METLINKQILVTGGAGYIGSIVVEQLILQGYNVIVVDNLQEGNRRAIIQEAVFYMGDFGDKNFIESVFSNNKIDAVFHFAAETTIEFSMTDPAKYFINNDVNGIVLLEVMRKHGCHKFIFSSTAATFGEPLYTPIDERHPQLPINAYGESKLQFEKILEWYHRAYGFHYNCFRYFNAAGASERLGEHHKHESHLIPVIIRSIQNRSQSDNNKLQIFGNDYPTKDGTCVRDYVHVIDIANAHILALRNLDVNPAAKYNLGNGKGFTNLEIIKMVEEVSGKKVNIEFAPRRKGDPAILIASSELANKELGWVPKYANLKTIIQSAWNWHRSNPNGYQE